MESKYKYHILGFLLLIVFISLQFVLASCNQDSLPTQFSIATVTLTATITATIEPELTPQITIPPIEFPSSPTIEPIKNISLSVFQHPDNLFSLRLPETWNSDISQTGAFFIDPDNNYILDVHVVNTGYSLNQESFHKFVNNREKNAFSKYDDYINLNRVYSSDQNSLITSKQLSTDDDLKSVATYYHQQEQAIIILDLWANKNRSDSFEDTFDSILESLEINVTAIANLDINSSDLDTLYQNDNFAIELPAYWHAEQSSGAYTEVNTYISPDEHAVVQTIIYDDGDNLSDQIAGDVVLSILRDQYAKDLAVVTDSFLPGGREQLTWKSEISDYQGITIFDVNETTLLVITAIWDNEFQEYYQGALENIIGSYQIPDGA